MDKVQTVYGRHWLWTALNETLLQDGCGNDGGLSVDLCFLACCPRVSKVWPVISTAGAPRGSGELAAE